MEQTAPAMDPAAAKQAAAGRNQAALRAMASGDLAGAETALSEAVGLDATSIPAWLNLAVVRRQRKDIEAAFAAIQTVLTLDPRNFPALLMSATMLESMGRGIPAALAYGRALANAPPDQALDAPTLKAVARGRVVHAAYTRQLGDHIRGQIGESEARCSAAERRRLDAFVDITLRVRRRYRQEPTEYYYPELPAIEFYEREEFPWLPEFESATAAVGKELADILREEEARFTPYIHYAEHMPLDQWRGLNQSRRWSAYHFFDRAKPIEDRCRMAPATIAAVSRLPQAAVAQRSPCAMYSALAPKTHIPPHTGIANFRLVVHLPLVVPPACRFRVGGEVREWRVGEGWVFDDTIEHEAWNDSDQARYILICDVWSPRLSPDERAAIAGVIAATDAFNGTVPGTHV
jgi:aspartyl/asparaginyl beta-hydroxylase (cupin superfamily)